MKRLSLALLASTAIVTLGIPTAQAATIDFGVLQAVNTLAQFTAAFPGAATSQFTTPGIYEETNTTTKTVINATSPLPSSSTAPGLSTVAVQNSSPLTSLVFTSVGTNASAYFPGFALSGSTWQYIQTLSTTNASFTETSGGTPLTPFSLTSIGLANPQSCNCSTSVTIEGFLSGSLVATQTVGIPGNFVGGNGNPGVPASVDIFALTGFGNVDTVEILPLGANVNFNDITIGAPVAAVPEPATWAMMLLGFVGLAFAFRKSRRMVSVA
jgi:hypothetical protein